MPKPSKNGRRFSVGFTLIELIIVIVVIGILALLVAVNFSGIVMKSKKAGFNVSAQSVLRAMQVKEAGEDGFDPLGLNETNIQSSLNITPNNFDSLTVYLYNNQDYVYIVGKNDYAGLIACGVRGNVSVELSEEASCPLGGSAYTVAKVTDTTAGTFGGGDGSTCALAMTIDSIEDLVALSNNVNGGNTYLNKCIKLAIDLDFNQSKSYVNPTSTAYGDINGNAVVEGLKTELTTGAGFRPIGSNTAMFRGTFKGELKSIYNLTINRPATSYVGLFGYIYSGAVNGLNLLSANVTGLDNTGGFFGYIKNTNATENHFIGNVTGNNNVGLISGYVYNDYSRPRLVGVTSQGNLTGVSNVGGIVGYAYSYSTTAGFIAGVYRGGSINATGSNFGRIRGGSGNIGGGASYLLSGLAFSSATVNGSVVSSNDQASNQGADIVSMADLNDINSSEQVRDTYIGGDEDNDGYYWDYDDDYNDIILKNTSSSPITFNLSGSGTSVDPYIINDYDDLKQASQKLSSTYKLSSNIDLAGKKFYMLGSYLNRFTGYFNGNIKTINNLTIDSPNNSYLGFSGYMNGTVTALNFTNMNITGQNYVGGVFGYSNSGDTTEIDLSGNITGNNYTGMMGGYLYNDNVIQRLTSVCVAGNLTGANYVGGLIGYTYTNSSKAGLISGIYKSGNIIATGANIGRIRGGSGSVGGGVAFLINGLALSTLSVNGSTITSSDQNNNNGADLSSMSDMNNINISEQVRDTYIGGDDDNNGYYWDYDNYGDIVLKDTASEPLAFNLSGGGTAGDPYIINDYADLRQATLKLSSTYRLNSNIDLSGQRYYMLGGYINRFSGYFDGNLKTISNMTINAPKSSYLGFSGFGTGTVTLLSLVNIDIIGQNNLGGVFGYAKSANATEISVTGDINGNSNLGLISGYFYNNGGTPRLTGTSLDGNISGVNNIGGIIGYEYSNSGTSSLLKGLIKGGAFVATGSGIGYLKGGWDGTGGCNQSKLGGLVLSGTTINGSSVASYSSTSINGAMITSLNELNDINTAEVVYDTYIGGDDDNNSYYWDYDGNGDVVMKNTTISPLTFNLSGSGTVADPYQINNYSELKQASLRLSSSYKLLQDIDMSGQKHYPLGTYQVKYSGTFDGNYKTISNLTIDSPKVSYIGFSGNSSGTIKNLNLSNQYINAYDYIGGVAAYNSGTIATINSSNPTMTGHDNVSAINSVNYKTVKGISVTDMNLSGNASIGGVAGTNTYGQTIKDCFATGNATGYDRVGLGVGDDSQGTLASFLVQGNVSSTSYVGAITGYNYDGNVKGIYMGGAIVGTTRVGRLMGRAYASSQFGYSISSATVNGVTVVSADTASINGADIVASDLTNSTIYTNAGFNFTDEALDYIWYIDGAYAKFREGNL